MNEDDQFDLGQFPDFMGLPGQFGPELFEEGEEPALEDGVIDRAIPTGCATWCFSPKMGDASFCRPGTVAGGDSSLGR